MVQEKDERKAEPVQIKAGLEIHQQLDTGKLFCRCPSILRLEKGDWVVKRKLHAVAGESGNVDLAAKHEAGKDKEFVYEGYKDTNCLIEFDEQPPLEIDKEALKIACQVALLLNCEVLPVTQIMRKTVIDGSNTSGFQRTLLVAKDGFIETSYGRVRIATVCLEEDAARIIEKDERRTIYRLDRLGIPLVEVATYPDIHYYAQVKEAALKLGEILRACRVKRGIGTIRQDVNISIPKSERVEIKGFQEPRIMVETVEKEAERQKKILEIHEKVKKFKKVNRLFSDLTKVFTNTECRLIKNVSDKNGKILGVKLGGFSGILGIGLYEGKRFGTELSDYAKVQGVGGIIHSDEIIEKYNLSEKEISEIKKILEIKEKDAFVLICSEDKVKAEKAILAVIDRVNLQITNSGLKEVRKSNPDASTSFIRPMPGADRMYPETDLPLLKIGRDFINEVKKSLPKLKTELSGELKNKGLNEEMISLVLDSGMLREFEDLIGLYNKPNFIAKLLLILPKEIASHEKLSSEKVNELFSLDVLELIIKDVASGKIKEDEVKHVLEQIAKGKSLKEAMMIEKADNSILEGEVAKIIKEKPGLNANAYMGLVMAKFKGKISGKEAMGIIGKLVS